MLVVVPFPMSEESRRAREAQLGVVQLGPGIEFHFRPVRAAPANYTSEHDAVLADVSILDACKRAQDEGYDAVCIDTMSDSGLAAARSLLDIPVIGPGRA
ncbi:MAG: aspartate/glutamate racemase family protein, partial [Burkholderiales bacterium]